MGNYYQTNNVYNSTDTLNNMLSVTVAGNLITILGQEYVLPSPVLYKQPTNLPNTLIYVISSLNGLIQQAVQITVSVNTSDEIVPQINLNNYYYLQGTNSFAAESVTVINGQMTAVLDPNSISSTQYVGSSFSLNGSVLVGMSPITPFPQATTSTPTTSGTTSTPTTSATTSSPTTSAVAGSGLTVG